METPAFPERTPLNIITFYGWNTTLPKRSGKVTDIEPREGEIRGMEQGSRRIFLNGVWRDCTSEYNAYHSASQRCENPRNKAWKDYGGRGILFRFASFNQFIEHMGLKPRPDLSIDRINNDGHYEVGNCRWATDEQQANNRTRQ